MSENLNNDLAEGGYNHAVVDTLAVDYESTSNIYWYIHQSLQPWHNIRGRSVAGGGTDEEGISPLELHPRLLEIVTLKHQLLQVSTHRVVSRV